MKILDPPLAFNVAHVLYFKTSIGVLNRVFFEAGTVAFCTGPGARVLKARGLEAKL